MIRPWTATWNEEHWDSAITSHWITYRWVNHVKSVVGQSIVSATRGFVGKIAVLRLAI